MITLLERLTKLADELDAAGSIKLANELDALIKEVMKREKEEEADIETNLTICPKCDGEGYTEDEAFCTACQGKGFIALAADDVDGLIKNAFIRKRDGKYCVISRKGKVLGKCFTSRKAALKRLREIEYFKHNK